jgi:hypothetical protein
MSLHLVAGKLAGKEKTCGKKVKYSTESAKLAAEAMNKKPTTRKELEAYPCFWCGSWHIGRKMSLDELKSYVGDET